MNAKYFVVPALLTCLATTSCNKSLLEQNAPDRLTTDNFWTNKDRALAGLSAAYSQLEGFVSWDNYVEARSVREFYREDFIKPGADAYNYTWWTDHYDFNVTSGNYAVDLLWRENYRGINFANQVLENVPAIPVEKLDDATKKQVLAEAHFLRAYYHFKLLTNFQKIILREKVPTAESDLPKTLSERAPAYDLILQDLKAAEADLPLRSQRPVTELGRLTKGAAQAYLGKVLLYRSAEEPAKANDYLDEGAGWLQKVVTSNEYTLDGNFPGMFNGQTKNSKESVFELQQTNDASNGAVYRSYLSDWVAASELGGYGEIYGTPRLLAEMLKEGKTATAGGYDPRVYNTLYFEDAYFNTPGAVYGNTYNNVFGAGSGTMAFRKWIPATPDRIGRSNGINVPLMRLADVLLMLAEIRNERSQTGPAMTLINQLRVHRGMPALSLTAVADIKNQLMHERVMEFTLEGSRFYDLRRWKLLSVNMTAAGRKFAGAEDEYYPLPMKETINNPLAK